MQTLGIMDIIWRGRAFPCEKGSKLKVGGIKNNVVTYGRKVARAQEFEASEITATIPLEKGVRYGNLWDAGEGELQVRCDTEQVFTWGDAFLTDHPEITGGEGGKMEFKWAGGAPEEIVG